MLGLQSCWDRPDGGQAWTPAVQLLFTWGVTLLHSRVDLGFQALGQSAYYRGLNYHPWVQTLGRLCADCYRELAERQTDWGKKKE